MMRACDQSDGPPRRPCAFPGTLHSAASAATTMHTPVLRNETLITTRQEHVRRQQEITTKTQSAPSPHGGMFRNRARRDRSVRARVPRGSAYIQGMQLTAGEGGVCRALLGADEPLTPPLLKVAVDHRVHWLLAAGAWRHSHGELHATLQRELRQAAAFDAWCEQ